MTNSRFKRIERERQAAPTSSAADKIARILKEDAAKAAEQSEGPDTLSPVWTGTVIGADGDVVDPPQVKAGGGDPYVRKMVAHCDKTGSHLTQSSTRDLSQKPVFG